MDHAATGQPISSNTRDTRRVPLGQLADREADARTKRGEGEFNSSI